MRKALFVCIILSILFSACTPSVTLPDSDIPESKATINIELDDNASVVTETVAVPTNTQVHTVTPEPTPTQTPEPTPTVKAESNIPSNIPTEKNENFDFEATDLLHWNEYQLVEVETLEESETVETAYEGENHLYLMPLTTYSERDLSYDIKKLTLPAGYTFNIKEKRLVRNEKGEMLTLGIVEDTFSVGSNTTKHVLLLNATDINGETQGFVETKEKVVDTFTFMGDNEVVEVKFPMGNLLAMQRLSEYQQEIGGFKAGEEISLLNVFHPIDTFDTGTDPVLRKPCPIGPNSLASGLYLISQKEESAIEVIKAKPRATGILPGPFAIETAGWTTAVGPTEEDDVIIKINADDTENADTRYFFKIEPIFSNIDFNKINMIRQVHLSEEESKIVFGATVTLVKEEPKGQVEMLNILSQNYNRYLDNNGSVPMVIPQGITMEKYFLKEGNIAALLGKDKPFPYYPYSFFNKYMDDAIKIIEDGN